MTDKEEVELARKCLAQKPTKQARIRGQIRNMIRWQPSYVADWSTKLDWGNRIRIQQYLHAQLALGVYDEER